MTCDAGVIQSGHIDEFHDGCIKSATHWSIRVMSTDRKGTDMNRSQTFSSATAGFVAATLGLIVLHLLLA